MYYSKRAQSIPRSQTGASLADFHPKVWRLALIVICKRVKNSNDVTNYKRRINGQSFVCVFNTISL